MDKMKDLVFTYDIPGDDFNRAGDASSKLKKILKQTGYNDDAIRKIVIATYEGEINAAIHGGGGHIEVKVFPGHTDIWVTDEGPGIPNLEKAMEEGYSTASAEVRSLGFGAGMGLPNIKKYSDELEIDTAPGKGTKVFMRVMS